MRSGEWLSKRRFVILLAFVSNALRAIGNPL